MSGAAAERELLNTLEDDHGFAALRAPSSGGGTPRDRPDLIAGKTPQSGVPGTCSADIVVVELKTRTGDWPTNIYLDQSEVESLWSFASHYMATPYIVVRPHRGRSDQDWHVFSMDALGTTPEGNRAIRTDDLPGAALAEVVGDG